jgi:putative Holliday junction resolvase
LIVNRYSFAPMRTLGIDLGGKRIGLALSDEGGRLATPLEVLTISAPEQALDPIVALIQKEGVERIVLGLPLNMDNTVGGAALAALSWGRQLGAKSAKPVVYVDERLSSFAAEQSLVERKRAGEKLTRGRKKAQLDAVAAATFLQQFLDGRLQPLDEKWLAEQCGTTDNF